MQKNSPDYIRKTIMGEKTETKTKERRLRTGCTLIDLNVGGGQGLGFPTGRVINIVGDSSTGKTFFGCELVAYNHHKYKDKFDFNYDDGEEGFTFDTRQLYGMDIIKKDSFRSRKVQNFDVHTTKFLNRLKEDQIGLYILDSLDSLTDETKEKRAKEREDNYDKGKEASNEAGTYSMEMQKFLSQEYFRHKCHQLQDKTASLVIISQVRDKINTTMFTNKYEKFTRAGGKALNFYAHTCLMLAVICKIKKKDRVVGILVEAYGAKSKTPRPYRKCRFIFYFDYGIDNIGSNLDYLFNLRGDSGELGKKAQEIIWEGKEYNLKNLKEWLETKKLTDKIKEERKKDQGKSEIHLSWTRDYIRKDEKLNAEFQEEFGTPKTRNELISMIEEDPKLEKELEQRVIDKWEAFEESIKTNRKRKFS